MCAIHLKMTVGYRRALPSRSADVYTRIFIGATARICDSSIEIITLAKSDLQHFATDQISKSRHANTLNMVDADRHHTPTRNPIVNFHCSFRKTRMLQNDEFFIPHGFTLDWVSSFCFGLALPAEIKL